MGKRSDEIRNIILNTVANASDTEPGELSPDLDLIHDLNLDSLAIYEIVVDLETAFEMQISDEDVDKLHTINDIAAYVEEHLED